MDTNMNANNISGVSTTDLSMTSFSNQVTEENEDSSLIFTRLQFYMIHITGGLVPLSLSVILCTRTIILLLWFNPKGNLYKLGIGERLTLYLALCDFAYSSLDFMQHVYIIAAGRTVPHVACAAIGKSS